MKSLNIKILAILFYFLLSLQLHASDGDMVASFEMSEEDYKEAELAFAKDQSEEQIYFELHQADEISIEEIFKKMDPKSLLSRSEKAEVLKTVFSRLAKPIFVFDEQSYEVIDETMSPQLAKLESALLGDGFYITEEMRKEKEVVEKYFESKDSSEFLEYLKSSYDGKKLSELALEYGRHGSYLNHLGKGTEFNKFLKVALDTGEFDANEYYNLLIGQLDSSFLGLKSNSELLNILGKYSHLAHEKVFLGNENAACVLAKAAFNYSDQSKIEAPATYQSQQFSTSSFPTFNIDTQSIQNKVIERSLSHIQKMEEIGIDTSLKCNDGRSPLDYFKILEGEGKLDFLDEDYKKMLGIVDEPCQFDIPNIQLFSLCDSALVASFLQRQNLKATRMAKRKSDIDLQFSSSEDVGGCSITVFDNIMKRNGLMRNREVEVRLGEDKTLFKSKDIKPFIEALMKEVDTK